MFFATPSRANKKWIRSTISVRLYPDSLVEYLNDTNQLFFNGTEQETPAYLKVWFDFPDKDETAVVAKKHMSFMYLEHIHPVYIHQLHLHTLKLATASLSAPDNLSSRTAVSLFDAAVALFSSAIWAIFSMFAATW